MNRRRLANLEERLERLIEGGFARLFRGTLQPREVALQLVRAIEDSIPPDEDRTAAPTVYVVRFAHDDLTPLLQQTPDLSQHLARYVITYCQDNALHLATHPQITLVADPGVPQGTIQVQATHGAPSPSTTQIMQAVAQFPEQPAPPPEAQLIVDGRRSVPLTRAIFNIGRFPDNDLTLEDLRISRHHVQIRLRNGRYVLYDRQSRAGTFVNGQRVNEHLLTSGDVIRLGAVSLLYMEEDEQHLALSDTQLDLLPPDLPEGAAP